MSKKDPVNLTQDQLKVAIPTSAAACFKEAYSGHRTLIEKMLEGAEITVQGHLKKIKRDWKLLSHKSKNQLLTKIFEQVRAILKVGDTGPSTSTFNSYRTKISRCMIYHVSLSDAHYNNRGLAAAMEMALKMKGGTLKSRMKKALAAYKEDENWAGHPPKLVSTGPRAGSSFPAQIAMPTPGTENSPEHLVYLFLLAIVQGGGQASLRDTMRDSEDPRFQRAYQLYLKAKDMLDDFSEEAEAA